MPSQNWALALSPLWLQQMEGPRAFANQTDVRIAIAEGHSNPAALKLRWSRRVHGDSPVFLLDPRLESRVMVESRP